MDLGLQGRSDGYTRGIDCQDWPRPRYPEGRHSQEESVQTEMYDKSYRPHRTGE